MVSTRCAVSFCNNTRYKVKQKNANITFHTFPVDNDVCLKWIQFCEQNKSWTPTKQSIICSAHFKPDDYQMSKLPLHQKRIELRRLHSNAVPSIINCMPVDQYEIIKDDDTAEHQGADTMAVMYREQICRTCLNRCEDEHLISLDSQIQNMTVLDMLIQLTAFETENNDAFPTVICLECKQKLELAYNIRQEFTAQSEFLVQLLAEEKLIDYCKEILLDAAERSSSRASSRGMSYNDNDNLVHHTLTIEHLSKDSVTSDLFQETHGMFHEETIEGLFEEQPSEVTDLIDHSCYTKVENESEAENKPELFLDKSTVENLQTIKSEPIPQAMDVKTEGTDDWENFQRTYELEKASVRKRKAEIKRALKNQQSKPFKSKSKRLEEEARIRFPVTTCYICDKKHDTIMERDLHMREHIPMLPYHCNECLETNVPKGTVSNDKSQTIENFGKDQPTVLKTINQLNSHFRMHRMPYKCEKCYRRFSTNLKLKTHLWALHGYGQNGLTCEYCGKQYFHRAVFRTHVAHHRNELSGQFKCSICDRSFGVKSSLQRHEASHKGERKFKCMYCDKSFSTSYNRLTHQRTHTGERPFKCSNCDRTFGQSTTLKAHQKLCPGDKMKPPQPRVRGPALLPSKDGRCPYPGCDYTASTYAAMYVHKRAKHMPVHTCEVCSKSFAFANSLKDHMMLHTGEKPHKCELCDRSFRRVEMYKRHLQTHKSDSNYICSICQKSFKLPQYLQAHRLTHSSERKFSCEVCGNNYKTKGELKKHNQRKHAEEIYEEVVIKAEGSHEV